MSARQRADHKNIGVELKKRVHDLGLTQAQAGRMAGLERSEVAKVFKGLYVKDRHYAAMAKALGTTLDAISTTLLRADQPDISPPPSVIAICSLKGGTGKSMTAAHLAGGLARRGYRVLIVDLDDSCQIQDWLAPEEFVESGPNIYDVLRRIEIDGTRLELDDVLIPSVVEGMFLTRSTEAISDLDLALSRESSADKRLMRAIKRMRTHFDFVIVDTAPDLDLRVQNALIAADSLLVPLKPSDTDLTRFYRFMPKLHAFAEDEDANPDLEILGFLLCEVVSVGEFERDVIHALEEDYPNAMFNAKIKKYKAFGQLIGHQELIYTYAPSKSGDYNAVVEECLKRLGVSETLEDEQGRA